MRWQVGAGAQRRELQRGHQRLRQCPAAAGGIGTAGGRLRIWGAAGGDKDGRTRVLFLRVPFLVSQANQRNTSFFGGFTGCVSLCVCSPCESVVFLFFLLLLFFFLCVHLFHFGSPWVLLLSPSAPPGVPTPGPPERRRSVGWRCGSPSQRVVGTGWYYALNTELSLIDCSVWCAVLVCSSTTSMERACFERKRMKQMHCLAKYGFAVPRSSVHARAEAKGWHTPMWVVGMVSLVFFFPSNISPTKQQAHLT